MKIENRIEEEEDEHSHKIEILNQNSNSALLGLDPWIDCLFSLPWSSPVEEQQNLFKKKGRIELKRGRRMKNSWEKKREKSLILNLAPLVSKSMYKMK